MQRRAPTYPYEDSGDDWDFAHVPVDTHADVRASLGTELDSICELYYSAKAPVPENPGVVFSLVLQNLNSITERYSAGLQKLMRWYAALSLKRLLQRC